MNKWENEESEYGEVALLPLGGGRELQEVGGGVGARLNHDRLCLLPQGLLRLRGAEDYAEGVGHDGHEAGQVLPPRPHHPL